MADPMREPTAYDEARRIGEIIKRLRSERGLTLDEVAERTGFVKSHVWEMEKGRGRDVTVRAVRAFAQCFGVPVLTFLGETDAALPLHPEAMRIAVQVDAALRGYRSSFPHNRHSQHHRADADPIDRECQRPGRMRGQRGQVGLQDRANGGA